MSIGSEPVDLCKYLSDSAFQLVSSLDKTFSYFNVR